MRLLPREEKFYTYFETQAQLSKEAADLLLQGMTAGGGQLTAAVVQIKSIEEQGDSIIHDIYARLHETFITPLDPEDLHNLASAMDDVLDGIEDVAYRIEAYRVDPVPTVAVLICEIVVNCVRELEGAFVALREDRPVLPHCIEINRLEEQADQVSRNCVRDLFETEKDPIRLLKLKEIYELLEQVSDRCEDVADVLQNVVVKNS